MKVFSFSRQSASITLIRFPFPISRIRGGCQIDFRNLPLKFDFALVILTTVPRDRLDRSSRRTFSVDGAPHSYREIVAMRHYNNDD